VLPINEGYAIPYAMVGSNLAGSDLTKYLSQILRFRGANIDAVKGIKESICYVAADFDSALKESTVSVAHEKLYSLPDGRTIKVGDERFRCPELLFNPSLANFPQEGLQNHLFDSIQKCDYDTRRDLFSNIILGGGSTLFEGISERLWQEVH